MAKLLKTDEMEFEVKPENGKTFELKELQEMVGGYIEIVHLPSGKEMVINEEGKNLGLPVNRLATELWKKEYPIEQYPENNDELVVGNALIIERGEME